MLASDDLLWGWDPTPGIVSVWADNSGRAQVWRRDPATGELRHERERFRPWLLLDRLDDLGHLGDAFGPESRASRPFQFRELNGPGALRFHVSADDGRALVNAILAGASRRLDRRLTSLRDLSSQGVLELPPEEQYLVATGRTYFRDLAFDQLHRLQFDLETTGLFAQRDRMFMVSVRYHDGSTEVLEAHGEGDAAEADLIRRLVDRIQRADPDVIENHNLHGFDLPFLDRRARRLSVPLMLGRVGPPGLRQRGARRGVVAGNPDEPRRVRFVAPGRELIDTLDAVRRHDFSTRELPGHGLKGVAHRVVKADVASLYPSLMRAYRIGPARDRLGALLALVDGLVERRLDAKAKARQAPAGSAERHTHEAMSAALKIVVNSAYGYLAAGGGLTRFADVHAANEVTRRGREVLGFMCRELEARGVTLLEADTDGVYFAVPDTWTEADERRVVADVGALLPPLVQLEFDGRYAAMLSHEPKNYPLLGYDATLLLRGVPFRSSRSEPFGEQFIRRSLKRLLVGDVVGVRDIYLATID